MYGGGDGRISLLEAATNVLLVFNMSGTMARQGGRVQLEQSEKRLPMNMANMAIEGFSHGAINETKYLIKKSPSQAGVEKKRGVEFPAHKEVKAAIQRHPAMLHQNQTSGCLPCQNGTPKNPQTRWRHKGTGTPPPDRWREPTPEPTPTVPLPGTPPAPLVYACGVQLFHIVHLPARYTYLNTALPCAECLDDEETKHNTDLDPDMVTDEG